MKDFTPITACLACGAETLKPYLSLGEQPLANDFRDIPVELPKYPLGLQLCTTCFHSQNLGAVNPDLLYRNYAYASGTSETLREYFRDFVVKVEKDFGIETWSQMSAPPKDVASKTLRVLDIASNDGALLRAFHARGHIVQGVDPAGNLRPEAIPTIARFWDETAALAATREGKLFDGIVVMNVLGHVAGPLTFLQLCKKVLAPGGRIYVQTSQALMATEAQFDTVYHEHLSFFTARSFEALATRAGLHIDKMTRVPIHGTSYLVELVATADECKVRPDMAASEKQLGFYDDRTYLTFKNRASLTINHVIGTVATFRREGYAVIGYGAAAKGVVFLNASQLHLDGLVDDAPLKIGKYVPGRDLKVEHPDTLDGGTQPTLFIILAWNMAPEIIARIKARRPNAKDKFLTYFPTVQVV